MPRFTRPWPKRRPRPPRPSGAVDNGSGAEGLGKPRESSAPAPARVDVALVGYQDQGNLGMGYLAAVLQRHGCTVDMIDVRHGGEKIAARLKARPPLIVGF